MDLGERVRLVDLGEHKDPSGLYLSDPAHFSGNWTAALARAVPWTDHEQVEADTRRREAWELCRDLARQPRILDRFADALAHRGVVGEERAGKLLFLSLVSRLLERPISVAVKRPSSGGQGSTTLALPTAPRPCYTPLCRRAGRRMGSEGSPVNLFRRLFGAPQQQTAPAPVSQRSPSPPLRQPPQPSGIDGDIPNEPLHRQVQPSTAKPHTTPVSVACPYCGTVLDPVPTRKKKCPHCKNIIYVNYSLTDPRKRLVTEPEATEIEQEWQAYHAEQALAQKFAQIGVTPTERLALEAEICQSQGRTPSPGDLLLAAASMALHEAMQRPDWQRMSLIYRLQASQLFDEGRPHIHLQQEAERASLMHEAQSEWAKGEKIKVEISTMNDARRCRYCAANEGKYIPIAEAIRTLPVPNEACEHGWCRCVLLVRNPDCDAYR